MVNRNLFLGMLAAYLPWAGAVAKHIPNDPQAPLTGDNAASDPVFPPASYLWSSGNHRSYHVVLPDNQTKIPPTGWPLIVDYHGRHGCAIQQWNNSQYYLNPSSQNYIVVYPNGCFEDSDDGGDDLSMAGKVKSTRRTGCDRSDEGLSAGEVEANGKKGCGSGSRAWEGAPYANPEAHDLVFTKDLLCKLKNDYTIDSTRIFASGKSNGGGFVGTLACSDVGDAFAGFAMASAALYTETIDLQPKCTGNRPRAILEAHGALDKIIPYGGRLDGSTPDIPQWIRNWAGRDSFVNSTNTTASGTPKWGWIYAASTASQSNIVQQYYVEKLGHCWPSKTSNSDTAGKNCNVHTLDFTSAVLNFFRRWQNNAPVLKCSDPDSEL